MEMISAWFFLYRECVFSWWWLTLGAVTFVYVVVFQLKDNDYSLSTLKALRLSFVGLITLIPWIRNFVPSKLEVDFTTRWLMLGLNSFFSFVITIAMYSFFLGPFFFILVFGARMFDYCLDQWGKSTLSRNIQQYGLKQAFKGMLQGPK